MNIQLKILLEVNDLFRSLIHLSFGSLFSSDGFKNAKCFKRMDVEEFVIPIKLVATSLLLREKLHFNFRENFEFDFMEPPPHIFKCWTFIWSRVPTL
jgi:hypothetical protein